MTTPRSFAHYNVTEKIGAGGMGEVFRATDSKLNRDVALKMLPDTVAQDPERLARFRREAQVLAALNHHGIAGIYGLESEGERHALAMELVTGPDLSERLAAGPLSVEEGMRVALELAEAIEAAHEKGIVHRDLKPANIKINDQGHVKVLDFGLAKALADDPAGGSSIDPAMSPTLTANMTMGNVILGTAAYMSPEQARGTEVDKRADIWAFGVVVVEMLGGRKLFAGETVSDTLASVLQAQIDLDDLPDNLPRPVKQLLRRCLQRDPKQRLRDIGDARIILQDVISGEIEEAPETASKGSSRVHWALTCALVVAVAAAVFGFMRPSDHQPLPLRKFSIPMDSKDPSTNVAFAPQISPNGQYLVYLSEEQIWVRDLASMVSRPLSGTEGAHYPFWSPDSEWIGFSTSSELKKIDRSGGQSTILAKMSGSQTMSSASSATWNPDGSIYYTTGNTGMLKSSSQAGEVTMHHAQQEGEIDFHEVCALPAGRGWVFVVHTKKDYGSLSVLTPDGKAKQVVAYPGDSINNPVWSPSGHILFERNQVADGIWAIPFSLDKLEVSGEPFLVAAGGSSPTVSVDGTLVYTAGVHQFQVQLAWYDRQGNFIESIADVSTSRPFPTLSPDDTQILLSCTTDDGREIWLFDTTNRNERRVTFDGLRWGEASWHPDGKRIISNVDSDFKAFLFTLDGSEPRRDLGLGALLRFSRDGETIFYSKPMMDGGFNFDIYSRPLDAPEEEGRKLVASPAIEWLPLPSPDGRHLLYVSEESGDQEIYATTYPDLTGRWQVSRGGGGWAQWRADGKEIYYTTHKEMFVVSVDDENGFMLGRPRKLFDRPSTDWSASWPDGFDVTAGGERFVMLRPAPTEEHVQPMLMVVQNWFREFGGE
ncbi:MAG: protein kinase [Candidatus Krumholzibacteriota bacterium]